MKNYILNIISNVKCDYCEQVSTDNCELFD